MSPVRAPAGLSQSTASTQSADGAKPTVEGTSHVTSRASRPSPGANDISQEFGCQWIFSKSENPMDSRVHYFQTNPLWISLGDISKFAARISVFQKGFKAVLPAKVGMWPSKTGHQVHANTTHHVWWEMTAEMFKICQGCISMTNRGQYSRKWKCNPKPVVVLTVGIFRGWCINCCSTVAKKTCWSSDEKPVFFLGRVANILLVLSRELGNFREWSTG